MTEQLTIKLNASSFEPLLTELMKRHGQAIATSNSDLVGKSVFMSYFLTYYKQELLGGKSFMELVEEKVGISTSELMISFLNAYNTFRKEGIDDTKIVDFAF